jgi:predicted Zn finger-like uncharacterized protein
MPYLFTCPHCETRTKVDDRYSGQAGQCVNCGKPIQLPEFAGGTTGGGQRQGDKLQSIRWLAGVVVSAIIMACLLFALMQFGGQSVSRMVANRDQSLSIKNLEQIAAALNVYAADYGNYPPPAITDQAGRPLLSWRVLLLPYLDEQKLYDGLDLTRSWDDPINAAQLSRMPTVFQHPNGPTRGLYNQSGYHLITGAGTLFPSTGPLGPGDIIDDPAQTILVIEARSNIGVTSWAQPGDVDIANIKATIQGGAEIELGGLLNEGLGMATTDGRGHLLPSSPDPLILRSLVTPRGGERLPDDTLN